jgi:hypothetical protein
MRGQPLLLLPEQEVRRIGRIHDVDVPDSRLVLLVDALEHALGPGALDIDVDLRIRGLEGLGDRFGNLDVHGRVPDDLAFLRRRVEHRRRRFLCKRRNRHGAPRKQS